MARRLSWGVLLLIACIGTPGDLDPSGEFVLGDGGDAPSALDSGWEFPDAGRDAGAHVGHPDASVKESDAGTGLDASVPDASTPDASVPDASTPDASVPDASVPVVDAGRVEIPGSHSPGDPRDPYHKHGGSACADCHGSNLLGGSGRSCYTCHSSSDHSIAFKGVMHRDGGESSCADCHGPNRSGGLGPACSTCHP